MDSAAHSIFLPSGRPDSARHHGLVYFIPGNPGLVEYYIPFFESLRYLLDESQTTAVVDIYGKSLAGFHDDDHEPFSKERPPYVVKDQIHFAYKSLLGRRIQGGCRDGQSYDFVIIMGHSVGSYISLELFHDHLKDDSAAPHLRLHFGILLFPTITHIAKSPNGLWLDLLNTVPLLERYGHRVVEGLLALLPRPVLTWITRSILGMSPASAETTSGFLKSRDGVWQALHMGKDEMRVISEEKWDEELWEIPREAQDHRHKVPKFMLLFGKHDEWVASHIRDEFIETRRGHADREGPPHKRGRTEIEVDEDGELPHAFCTRQSRSRPLSVLSQPR
jgi:hypothetical protein